jgi:hypothetical protein
MNEKRQNCWEHRKCGREPGGQNAKELGVCPASVDKDCDGMNKGENAGRFCWAVAGTLCKGVVQGTFASKLKSCLMCPFYQDVERQEGRDFKLVPPDLTRTSP